MTERALRHWLREITSRSAAGDGDRALAKVTVAVLGGEAVVGDAEHSKAVPLFEAHGLEAATVRIQPAVYGAIPTSDARARLLGEAAGIAPIVRVHAPLLDGAHRGRLAIDLPRRLLRRVGLRAAEPGDRFADPYRHLLFDDEAIATEGASAGLAFTAREGAWVVFRREAQPAESANTFATECVHAARTILGAERIRRGESPERAVAFMRARGLSAPARGVVGRARLRRAIGWVDAAFPGGPNCFRRVLTEVSLDGGAAKETLVFGLDVGKTGHVAFKGAEERSFDVAFEIRG